MDPETIDTYKQELASETEQKVSIPKYGPKLVRPTGSILERMSSREEEDQKEDAKVHESRKHLISKWDITPVTSHSEYFTDEYLDSILPPGYEIVQVPEGYKVKPAGEFTIQKSHAPTTVTNLPLLRQNDIQFFHKLLDTRENLSIDELKERKLLKLLLSIKNGDNIERKQSIRVLTSRIHEFGPSLLYDTLLSLMMTTLSEQERHQMIKVLERVIIRVNAKEYCHKILVVAEPLLIDADYYTRIEAREIISTLSKSVGLACVIANIRPDIDSNDEYIRNITARTIAVFSSALGINNLLPFIKAVCNSKRINARYTGVRSVRELSILVGSQVLPYLSELVDCIGANLGDSNTRLRILSAQSIAALAEASQPYGFESFQSILLPLWSGLERSRGRLLASYIKALGCIIPLMEDATEYSKRMMRILEREFDSGDDEMRRIVLQVVKGMIEFINTHKFIRSFWNRRVANDKRMSRLVVDISSQFKDFEEITSLLKDESDDLRRMVLECISKGSVHLESSKELLDGLVFCITEANDTNTIDHISKVLLKVGISEDIYSLLLHRLNNKNSIIRQLTCELIGKISSKVDEKILLKLYSTLTEYLGEEFPDVLASVLYALHSITQVIRIEELQELIPRLTPILRNRHDRVQIEVISLIKGSIEVDVSAREMMRIVFELLESLRAPRRKIRRLAIETIGMIAKKIGPSDVLSALLSNLRVQERQLRVCSTIAIAVVSQVCEAYTVLPVLMSEYRTPDMNVQNGVLKSCQFMFEYIENVEDYVYAITPLLEDALIDRDIVHRQISCYVIRHLAIGCYGKDREDALIHLLNFIHPNIFEKSVHMHLAYMEAIEGISLSVPIIGYLLSGLFHSARKVRESYWKVWNMCYYNQCDKMSIMYPKVEGSEIDFVF